MKIKTNSRESEKAFIENIRKFFDNPYVILPECTDNCFLCPIKGYKKKIDKMKDNNKYDKYHNSADQFLSSISETYKILKDETAPIMGLIKTNYGSVSYCKRGNTDETIMSGVQNYDNDIYRLLAFTNTVKLKKISVFSTKNYFTATCKKNISIDFLKDLFNEENIDFKYNDNFILGNNGNKLTLNIYNIKIDVYEDFNYNIVFILLKHMLIPDIDFNIITDFMDYIPDDKSLINYYISNRLNTKQFITKIKNYKISYAIKNKYYIINNINYSIDDFINALDFDEKIKPFIKEKLMERDSGFYLENASQRKVLEYLFPKYKNEIIKIMYGLNDNEIKKLHGNPLEIMETAKLEKNKKNITSEITKPWSENSEYLINLITDYFNYGKNDAIINGRKKMKNDIQKSIYYAFLNSINEKEVWLFTDNEKLLGERLKPYIKDMINDNNINEKLEEIKSML